MLYCDVHGLSSDLRDSQRARNKREDVCMVNWQLSWCLLSVSALVSQLLWQDHIVVCLQHLGLLQNGKNERCDVQECLHHFIAWFIERTLLLVSSGSPDN